MALRLGAAPREKTSKLLPLLQEALRGGGSLTGEEACRLLLKLPRVRPDTARRLLETALDGDRRFLLMEDGSVSLAHAPEPSPVPLDQLAFTVVDLETTGGSAADRILEVGAVRVAQYRLADEFSTLINPGVPIPPFIASMTGIREAMLADAPPFRDVAEKLLEFLGDSVLVAHNLSFDLGFLNRELSLTCGLVLAPLSLCTLRLGRRLLPHLPDRRLDTVAGHYGIAIEARHRALGDARATAHILIRLLGELAGRGIQKLDEVATFLGDERSRRLRGRVNGARLTRSSPRDSPPNVES